MAPHDVAAVRSIPRASVPRFLEVEHMAQFTQRLLESTMAIVHPEVDDAAAPPASKAVPVLFFLVHAETGHLVAMKGTVSRPRG